MGEMKDEFSSKRREFICEVLSAVYDGHSHNVTGVCKRLERTFHSFQSECVFNATANIHLMLMLDKLRIILKPLRVIAAGDDSGIESVKRKCLSAVGELNDIIGDMEFREINPVHSPGIPGEVVLEVVPTAADSDKVAA